MSRCPQWAAVVLLLWNFTQFVVSSPPPNFTIAVPDILPETRLFAIVTPIPHNLLTTARQLLILDEFFFKEFANDYHSLVFCHAVSLHVTGSSSVLLPPVVRIHIMSRRLLDIYRSFPVPMIFLRHLLSNFCLWKYKEVHTKMENPPVR